MESKKYSAAVFQSHRYNCSALLESRRARLGDKTALVFENRTWTWNKFSEAVERFALYFKSKGISQGDRVALIATNSDTYAISFLAIARLGAAAVTVNCELSSKEILGILDKVRPKLILCSQDRLDKIPQAEAILLDSSDNKSSDLWRLSKQANGNLPAEPDPESTCLIMFTSGTTGSPKGVMHSHKNFVLSGEGFIQRMDLSHKERMLCVLPLFHINALFYSFAGALVSGATIIFDRRFSASRFWKTVTSTRATQVNLIAAAGNILLRRSRSEFIASHTLSKIYLSPLTPALHAGFQDEFKVPCLREGYGLTEAPGVINQPIDQPPKIGSMGRISLHPDDMRPLAELKIVDRAGKQVADDNVGELLVRSPILMQGYFEDQGATDAVIKNGWFSTGDLARMNDKGDFFFIERIKDIIRRRGENISGAELDSVISGHPNVAQVAVVATPSKLGEDEILAAIVLSGELSALEFKKWCFSILPENKRPRFVVFCQDLPRTPSEKIEKYKVRHNRDIRKKAIDLFKI